MGKPGQVLELATVPSGNPLSELESHEQEMILRDELRRQALSVHINKLLDQSEISVSDKFVACPGDLAIYRGEKEPAHVQRFTPEKLTALYADEQKAKGLTGFDVRQKLIAKGIPLLGMAHLQVILANPWRYPERLLPFSLAFLGVAFCKPDRASVRSVTPSELSIPVLFSDEGEMQIELRRLSDTFDRYYPIAVGEISPA